MMTKRQTNEVMKVIFNFISDGFIGFSQTFHSKIKLFHEKKKFISFYVVTEDHFDLDLKEAIEAPPLSLSTPDLHDISAHHNPFQPLRRSASSSELLYEKVTYHTLSSLFKYKI